jgi:hypothetical protein
MTKNNKIQLVSFLIICIALFTAFKLFQKKQITSDNNPSKNLPPNVTIGTPPAGGAVYKTSNLSLEAANGLLPANFPTDKTATATKTEEHQDPDQHYLHLQYYSKSTVTANKDLFTSYLTGEHWTITPNKSSATKVLLQATNQTGSKIIINLQATSTNNFSLVDIVYFIK